MITPKDRDLQEVQEIIVHDLAVHEMNNDDDLHYDNEVAYVQGYKKGWWAAYLSAESKWKEKAKMYDQLIKEKSNE